MAAGLAQSQLPSRQELAALAERFTHVEMRLDDMDAKLDRIEKLLTQPSASDAKRNRTAKTRGSKKKGVK